MKCSSVCLSYCYSQSCVHNMLSLRLALLIILLANTSFGFKILCLFPYHGKSHHMVFEPILNELTNRGHELTVVSFFPPKQPWKNRRDVALTPLSPLNVEVFSLKDFDRPYSGLEKYFEHLNAVKYLAKSNLELCKKLLDSEIMDEFVKAKGDYDVILTEHFNSDCMLGLIYNYNLPHVGLMSHAMLPWSYERVGAPDNPSYVPGMTLDLTDKMSFIERINNAFFLYYYLIWYEVAIRWEEQAILERKLGRKLPRLEDVGKNASVVLVNTHYSWNGVRVFPPSVVEVGGIHLHGRKDQPLPNDLQKWMDDSKNGVIIVSFGSLIKGSSLPPKLKETILKVFARLPQRILWKWEDEDFKDLPPNVKIMRWLPLYDLLRHNNTKAFITHGGLLSLTEAISAAVPVLVVPILGDQFGNAAHAQAAGVGRVVRLRELDEEGFSETLMDVLSEGMRNCTKRVSNIWHERVSSPMDTAIFHIELTAKYRLQLSSQARWLNRAQLALLDIIGLLIVIAGIVVLCFNLVLRFSFRKKVKSD